MKLIVFIVDNRSSHEIETKKNKKGKPKVR